MCSEVAHENIGIDPSVQLSCLEIIKILDSERSMMEVA